MNKLTNEEIKVLSFFNIILMAVACFKALQFWAISSLFSTIPTQAGVIFDTQLIFLALLFAMSLFATIIGLIRKSFSKIDVCIIILGIIGFVLGVILIKF